MNSRTLSFMLTGALCLFCVTAHAAVVDKVLAVVNDELITQSELERLLLPVYTKYRQQYQGDELILKVDEARRELLNQMINDKLLLSEAKKRDIGIQPERIEEKMAELKQQFASEKAFERAVIEEGMTLPEMQQRIKYQLLKERFVEMEVRAKTVITPAAVHEYYQKHQERFMVAEEVHLLGIVIKVTDEIYREQAYRRAQEIRERLQAGEDFSELATLYSEGSNAKEGGDMGYIKRGQLMEVLDTAAFALETGQISEVLESGLGYHILKVADKKEQQLISFEDVSEDIKRFLFNQQAKARYEKLIEQLKSSAYISIK